MEDSEQPSPKLVVIAGPNGSGKTTITDLLRSQGYDLGEYINPDEITLELLKDHNSPTTEETYQANRKAQDLSEERRQAALDGKRSLSFETVMSHPSKVDFMREAKARGYEISFYFVGTDDPLINLERIKDRVEKGGHNVPVEKTLARYERVMDLLPEAVKSSDYAELYDNSRDDDPLRLAAAISEGKTIVYIDDPPHWVMERLLYQLESGLMDTWADTADKDKAAKAKDFLSSHAIELVKKYPGDQDIIDALAIRKVAGSFATRHFQKTEDREHFIKITDRRLAYNIAHGKPNHSPLLKDKQQQTPPRQMR